MSSHDRFGELEVEADLEYDGPVDDYGEPKISNETLDIEARFTSKGVQYRFYFEGTPTRQATAGPWHDKREDAYQQGKRWVKEGRL